MATVETQAPTEVRAQANYVRTAPRKAQLVAEQIRGRTVPEARTILTFMTRDAAGDVARVLESAVANAEANHGLSGDELYVSAAYVGAGPTLKRWRARARGRVARIRKRTCHITVRLAMPDHSEIPLTPVAPPPEPIAAPEPEARRSPRPRSGPPKPEAESARSGAEGRGAAAEAGSRRPAETRDAREGEAEARPRQEGRRGDRDRRQAQARHAQRRRRKRRSPSGTEGSSRRPPGRHHPRLEVELVHGKEGLPRCADRGRQDPRAHLREARPRRPLGHPDPQGQAADHDRHLHRSPGHRDRQVGRRGGRAAPRGARHDAEERPHQHQRDQAPGARREARRAVDRRAAPEPRQLPPRHEAVAGLCDALGRPGRQDHVRRPPRRRRDVALGDLLRGPRPAPHAACRHRLRLRRGEDDLRPDRRQGLDQQGRDHAGGLRHRSHRQRPARGSGSSAPPRRSRRSRPARGRAPRAGPRGPRPRPQAAPKRAAAPAAPGAAARVAAAPLRRSSLARTRRVGPRRAASSRSSSPRRRRCRRRSPRRPTRPRRSSRPRIRRSSRARATRRQS